MISPRMAVFALVYNLFADGEIKTTKIAKLCGGLKVEVLKTGAVFLSCFDSMNNIVWLWDANDWSERREFQVLDGDIWKFQEKIKAPVSVAPVL